MDINYDDFTDWPGTSTMDVNMAQVVETIQGTNSTKNKEV